MWNKDSLPNWLAADRMCFFVILTFNKYVPTAVRLSGYLRWHRPSPFMWGGHIFSSLCYVTLESQRCPFLAQMTFENVLSDNLPSRRAGEREEVRVISYTQNRKLLLKADGPQVGQRHEYVERKWDYFHIIITIIIIIVIIITITIIAFA